MGCQICSPKTLSSPSPQDRELQGSPLTLSRPGEEHHVLLLGITHLV